MKIILNYKSYYEAFKLGVTDNGFTDVARLLFYPIFEDKTILDENLNPYDVDNVKQVLGETDIKQFLKKYRQPLGRMKCLRRSLNISTHQ